MSAVEISSRALASIQEARRYVFRDEDDSSRDGILIDAVNLASDAVIDHLKRDLVAQDNLARTFELDRSGFVDLRPYELRAIDAILVHPDRPASEQETLTADDYRAFPLGGSEQGTYFWLQLRKPRLGQLYPGFGWQVRVTGDWGLAQVPNGIKLACLQWVKNIVENPGAYASSAMSGYTVIPDDVGPTPAVSGGMPAAVRHRLKRYRRQTLLL